MTPPVARRMTYQTCLVLTEFLKDPDAELYGQRIREQTGLRPGTLYPILHRLYDDGLLTDRLERNTGSARPPRRYYKLTKRGLEAAHRVPKRK